MSDRSRVVLHADMDAFFASIEQRDRPELRGKPVIVGGLSRRGVVSAASYEARRYGVHSAMPTGEARRLCPEGVFVAGDLPRYREESRAVFAIFRRFTPRVEGLSLDEAFLDLTGTDRLLGPPREVGKRLREAVRRERGLAVSVGIGPSKLVAKLASAAAKPDGLLEVPPEGVRAFLDPLAVGRLWGVGPVAEARLAALGIRRVGELARSDPERLRAAFGRAAEELVRRARGEDPRPIEPEREARSLSEENTFEEDVRDHARLRAAVHHHADAVARRLRRLDLRARTVFVKVRLARRRRPGRAGYPLLTRHLTLSDPTASGVRIARVACELLERLPEEPVRLVGVGVSGLEPARPGQPALFGEPGEERAERLERALDAILERYGPGTIRRGAADRPQPAAPTTRLGSGEPPEGG